MKGCLRHKGWRGLRLVLITTKSKLDFSCERVRGSMNSTVFERYGGFAKISRIVSAFYDRVLDSAVAGPYFAHTDMRRQIDHQTKFISTLMGGPASYGDEHLERVHAGHEITNRAFDEVVTLLQETLEDHGVEDHDVRQICEAFQGRRRIIVTRHDND